MRIGLHAGYWSARPPSGIESLLTDLDGDLDSVWTAEAYGSDALTPLAWWGSVTRRMRLGTAIAQMAARTPTATAMAAITLDHLSAGRFTLGLGASGPQVVEGWYGQPYDRPLARTREYVAIIRDVIARQAPVTAPGPAYPLPYDGPGATGLGKPLRSTVHPRGSIPVYLAAQGPRNIALAAEIADGWLPLFYSPRLDQEFRSLLDEGFALRSPLRSPATEFEIAATVPVVVDDDIERAADQLRPWVALYAGGMGARSANFHRRALQRLGYEEVLEEVARHFPDGHRDQAAAAIPTSMVRDIALIGPPEAIAAGLQQWRQSAVTTLLVQGDALAVRTVLHAETVAGDHSLLGKPDRPA